MAKKKKGSMENPITTDDLQEIFNGGKVRGFRITEAKLVDDYCNYKYEVTDTIGQGDSHDVKGKGIVKDTLKDAFAALNVHLACLDDVYKHSGIEVDNVRDVINDNRTFLYNVTGIKIKGSGDDISVILCGTKHVSVGGRIALETPRVALDNLSGYKPYDDLKADVETLLEEVSLYREGNYITADVEDTIDAKQSKMEFGEEGTDASEEEIHSDFENAQM